MKIKKLITLIAVSILLASTVWAQATITTSTPTQDADGYYLIGSAAELYGFAELVNNGNAAANAKLTADIVVNENVLDANGEANTGDFVQWTPIGNDDNSTTYSGTFDGQGHTISGLYVSGNGWYVGFVGQVIGTAVVKNLGIVDSYFSSSKNHLGSIVGGVSYNSSVTLANVYSTSTVNGANWIGGLVGGTGNGSVAVINSYFAGKTSTGWNYGTHHDDLVSGSFNVSNKGTLNIVNTFVVGTSQYGTSVTAEQLSDGTVAAALHYYQDALADGSMFGLSGGKTDFSGTLEGVSVTTANITLHTFDGDATAYSSKYIVGNTTPLPVNVVRKGYTFLGWYDNVDFEGDAVIQIPSSATGDKEYWAKFVRSHSVSFVLNDGSIFKGEIDHYIEGETTVLPTFVTKDGASFEGWYTTEDFTGSRYYSIPATATEDMTFYAKWGAEKTTFYLQQGLEPVNVLYEGENVVYLDKTTMYGYYVSDEYLDSWGGSSGSVNVPYTGGESTFGNGSVAFNVAQSGFYVFTLTDKGDGNWFVSVLRSVYNCTIATQTYTGSAIEPEIVCDGITLVKGTDYDVSYSDNINVGTAKATITGIGNYSGTVEKTFTINAKALTAANVSDLSAQTYTGSAIEPEITVTDGDPPLTLGTDYEVTYTDNTNVGTATATISGKGNYSGKVEKTFTIKPRVSFECGALTITEDQNGKTATLDGAYTGNVSLVIDEDHTVTSVTFNRTFTPGATSTIILPFAVSSRNYSGGTFYEFQSVDYENGKWVASLTKVADDIAANKPYLFVPSGDKLTITGSVTLTATLAEEYADNKGDWSFTGVYKVKDWKTGVKTDYFFASASTTSTAGNAVNAGDFVRIGNECHLNPLRCYLSYSGSDQSLSKSAKELPTSIEVRLIDEVASVVEPNDNPSESGEIITLVSEITPDSGIKVWSFGGTVIIEAQPDMDYTIVDLSGRTLKNGVTTSTRETVTLSRRTAGIVIVKIGGKTFKVNY